MMMMMMMMMMTGIKAPIAVATDQDWILCDLVNVQQHLG
jgi:hypothetical protein